jgi:hypothetical protein
VTPSHSDPTLTPHFREFLPEWVARQSWYAGPQAAALRPIGYIRLQDPAGLTGLETHLMTEGANVYQVPLAYRGAPEPTANLITEAEHSDLGPRWIYDGVTDTVWIDTVLRMVLANGASEPEPDRQPAPADARGRLLTSARPEIADLALRVRRILAAGRPTDAAGAIGVVTGTWYPDGPAAPPTRGWLATVHPR